MHNPKSQNIKIFSKSSTIQPCEVKNKNVCSYQPEETCSYEPTQDCMRKPMRECTKECKKSWLCKHCTVLTNSPVTMSTALMPDKPNEILIEAPMLTTPTTKEAPMITTTLSTMNSSRG